MSDHLIDAERYLANLDKLVDAFTDTDPELWGRVTEPIEKPKCECGAESTGIMPFEIGHSNWCPVYGGDL